ncbi:MAG: hypothetical protein FE78DRAFT_33232 [Acidomyces sp. 'richmondensis']|nr:MAG: hypothetical protein FE78DRAFT_33232 [Acidomyces sp. 'richmondensis']
MSASGDLGPAPSGVNLSQTQVPSMYGAIITTAVAGTLAVICRFYARITFGNPIGADDLLIICALIFTWGTAVATFVAIPSGMGRHLWVLTLKDFDKLWQITVIIVIFNSCKPLTYFWAQYTDPKAKGTCIRISTFFFANGIWPFSSLIEHIVTSDDHRLARHAVPLPLVWRLQMSTRQKFAVVDVFILGGFAVVASIVRIVMLERNTQSIDPVWGIAPVYVWSSVEPFVGIICACLPTLSPLFKRIWNARKTQIGSSGAKFSDGAHSMSIDTIFGSRNKRNKLHGRLRPDDEIMLTTTAGTQTGTVMESHSEEDVHEFRHIHVQRDFDLEWGSRKNF